MAWIHSVAAQDVRRRARADGPVAYPDGRRSACAVMQQTLVPVPQTY